MTNHAAGSHQSDTPEMRAVLEPLESRRLLSSTPFGGVAASLPGLIEAENFDKSAEGAAYHDTTSANQGGAYRRTAVDIERTSDTGGGYDVGWTHAGEWLNYTVTVATAGRYDLSVRTANVAIGGTFHINVDGVNVTGAMTVPDTGGWQNWATIADSSSVTLSAGTHVFRLAMDTNSGHRGHGMVGNFNWIQCTAAPLNLLFFGNSFTVENNLSSLVSQVAVAAGHATPNVFTQATPSWTLTDHLNKIASDGSGNIISSSLPKGATWDDVVIQEYSTRPASVTAAPINGDPAGFRRDAATLFGLVHTNSPAVHDVLLETWARGPANPFYPGSYPNPAAMQNDILTQYNGAAADANRTYGRGTATVAYAGEGWRAENFDASMYDASDEYHPSQKGSVLAALIVERRIYHDNVAAISASAAASLLSAEGLSAGDWAALTAIADAVE